MRTTVGRKRTVLSGIACVLGLSVPVLAGSDGGSALSFLQMGAGPKQTSMGNAGVAFTGESSDGYLNPASLSLSTFREIQFVYNRLYEDLRHGTFNFRSPTRRWGTWSLGVESLDYGDIPGTDENGASTSEIEAGDTLIRLGWAPRTDGLMPGVRLKYFQESLDGTSAGGLAVDLGVVYRPKPKLDDDGFFQEQLNSLSFGAAVRHLGPKITFERESEDLPLSYVAGIAHVSFSDSLRVAFDLSKTADRDEAVNVHVGMDLILKGALALRVGYRSDHDDGAGFGGGVGIFFQNVSLDYAFVPYEALGDTHRIAVSFKFGRGLFNQYYEEGIGHMRNGRYAEALMAFDKALLINPRDRRALRNAFQSGRMLEETEALEPAADPKD